MKTKLLTIIFLFISAITLSQTTSIPDANFENYLEANGMGNGIANDNLVTTANINTVTFLDVSTVGNITDLTGIEAFVALDYLICEGNQITTLNLSQNTVLTSLFANANLLTSLNIQNGNNSNVTNFMTSNNPNLNCIQVDDVAYSNTNWTNIDTQTSFSTACSAISGIVSYNCTTPVAQQNVQIKATASSSGNIYYTTTNSLGEYAFNINETGAVIIETAAPNLVSTPTNYNVTYAGQSISAQDFCVENATMGDDVHVTLVPLTPAPRPGFASLYRIYYGNYGSTTQSGDIKFLYDASKVASVSSPDTFTQIGSELKWVYNNLAPFEIRYIDVVLNINPATGTNAVAAGDYLLNTVLINPITGDIFQQDNSDETYEEVVNGYDPNDATIFEGPYIQPSQSSDFLNFRIRFQNTGTASAINIDVKTMLDANLDLTTFTLLGSSHTMNTSIINQNDVTFSFPAINLDYQSNNEPASHGWVTFKIKPIAGFAFGDIISSQASIFFDTNAPIITNTATVQIAPPGLTYVPDNNFENYLETHNANGNIVPLGDPTSMGNGIPNDDYVTTASINTVAFLNVSNKNIADLTGIEDFTALTGLFVSNNQLTSLDVTQNTSLITLYCFNNLLTNLDVTQNTALTTLRCYDNQLTSLDVIQNTSLTELLCHNNLLTSLDVTQNSSLTSLVCANNQLTSLNVTQNTVLTDLSCYNNQLTSLNVTQNTNLISLGCANNQLTSLNVTHNTSLTQLSCYTNQLTSLDVTQNSSLTSLNCSNNQLTSLNVTQNTNLISLSCINNQLTSLDVTQNSSLTALLCSNNQLTSLNVTQNPVLTQLWCTNNQLTSLDVTQNTSLIQILSSNNQLTSLNAKNGNNTNFTGFSAQNNPNLTCIEVDNAAWSTTNWTNKDATSSFSTNCTNAETYVPDDNFENYLETHNANGNIVPLGDPTSMGNGIPNDDYVTTATINTVTSLNISGQNISDLTGIEGFTALTVLNCNTNQLTSLNVTQNTALTALYVSENQITSLDVTQNTALTQLTCHTNQLTSLDVTQNTSLTSLNCNNNQLTSLDVTQNTFLTELYCGNNQLTSLNVTQNTSLIKLNCGNNQLTSLDVTQNTSLTQLLCHINQLTSLNVTQNTVLTELWCNDNQLTSLDVIQNTSLNSLLCAHNQLTSLNVKNGNNINFTSFASIGNPNLTCIEVDDASWSTTNWTNIDAASSFSENCALQGLTYVPDDNFENYLETHDASGAVVAVGDPTSMGNGIASDDYVTTASINTVTELDIEDQEINDLIGIEDFILLEILYCHTNSISSLDLSSNINLITLICSNNALTSLDVTQNPNLTSLDISINQISSLAINNSNLLTELFILSNQFTHFDASGFTNLIDFRCANNQLTSLNIKNGNNLNLPYFDSKDNPNLTCIEVDDAAWSTTNWTNKDATSTFVNNQAECTALSTDDYNELEFALYPNPVQKTLNIFTEIKGKSILYDINGKQIKEFSILEGLNKINLINLPKGVYLLKTIGENLSKTSKIIIE